MPHWRSLHHNSRGCSYGENFGMLHCWCQKDTVEMASGTQAKLVFFHELHALAKCRSVVAIILQGWSTCVGYTSSWLCLMHWNGFVGGLHLSCMPFIPLFRSHFLPIPSIGAGQGALQRVFLHSFPQKLCSVRSQFTRYTLLPGNIIRSMLSRHFFHVQLCLHWLEMFVWFWEGPCKKLTSWPWFRVRNWTDCLIYSGW